MGEHIAEGFLAAFAAAERERAAVAPGRSTSEDELFEEEGGHPGKLNEGYVVVRKRDLL